MPSAPPDRMHGLMMLAMGAGRLLGVQVTPDTLPNLLPAGVDHAAARRALANITQPPFDDEPTVLLSRPQPHEREQ